MCNDERLRISVFPIFTILNKYKITERIVYVKIKLCFCLSYQYKYTHYFLNTPLPVSARCYCRFLHTHGDAHDTRW